MPGSGDETDNEDDKDNPYDQMSYEELLEYFGQNPGQLEEADLDDLTKARIEDYLASNPIQTPLPPIGDGGQQQGPPLPPDYEPPGAGTAPDLPGTTGGVPPVTPPPVDPSVTPDIDPGVIPGVGSIYQGTFVPISAIKGQLDDMRRDDLEAYNRIMQNVSPDGAFVEIDESVLSALEEYQQQADAPGQTRATPPDDVTAPPDTNPQAPVDDVSLTDDLTNVDPEPFELDIKLILDLLEAGDSAAAQAALAAAANAAATQQKVSDTAEETQEVVTTTAAETQAAIDELQRAVDEGALTFEELVNSGFLDLTETFADQYAEIARQIESGQTDLASVVSSGVAEINTDIAEQLAGVTGDLGEAVEGIGDAASDVTAAADTITSTAGEITQTVDEGLQNVTELIESGQVTLQQLLDAGLLDITASNEQTANAIAEVVASGQADIATLVENGLIQVNEDVVAAVGGLEGNLEEIAGQLSDTEQLVSSTAQETQDVIEETSQATNQAISEVAEQLGVTEEEIQRAIREGDSKVIEQLEQLQGVVDRLPGPIADLLAPYFENLQEGVSTLTSSQEKSLQEILEAVGNMNVPIVSAIAESTADTIGAVTAVKDTITDLAEATYERFFAPDEPGPPMTAESYAEDQARTASIDRSGPPAGTGGREVIGGGSTTGIGTGSRDPVSVADYISVDNDTATGSGGGNVTTDPNAGGGGAQSNAFLRPVPIANQELFGGYMGQAQRLSGTLDTYPQLQRQASEQYGVQVASQFPSLNPTQQSLFAQYVTGKVQAKAGIGDDPGFLPYDIYNIVAPRLSEVLGDVGYYQYSSGRRIPGFMNYMPEYQDSMFNRQDLAVEPLPGGPPPPQTGVV